MGGMAVGDSFFIPTLDSRPVIKTAASLAAKFNYKVKAKAVIENRIKGVRVWRLA
jgi:hypothetical protein